MNAFAETRSLFIEALNYTSPLTFDNWMGLAPVPRFSKKTGTYVEPKPSDDLRAAALYVQFYEQITLAWYKVRSYYTLEEDGVSTVLQYLQKNVPVIAANPKRFNPRYIYQVAFNCLYCICHDLILERERFAREVSNVTLTDDGEVDLFDLVPGKDGLDAELIRRKFWNIVYSACQDEDGGIDGRTEAVLNKLLGGTAGLVVFYVDDTKTRTAFGPCEKSTPRCRVNREYEANIMSKIRNALVAAGFCY